MKIFISHASKDKEYGNILVELLRNLGLNENQIIFTSNVAYGIPVGQNIFRWLKSQIEEKPFVIYLLSNDYYQSIACLNEMGAAWIIENNHAAIFTPEFNLSSKEFHSGALDPREIGFFINDEDRIMTFIQMISDEFQICNKPVLISQYVKKYITDLDNIKTKYANEKKSDNTTKEIQLESKPTSSDAPNTILPNIGNSAYEKLINCIVNEKLKVDELLLLLYCVETGRFKLGIGWQTDSEVQHIKEWEKINSIRNILSSNYKGAVSRFELRGFIEDSAFTVHGNPKEVTFKSEILYRILDLPENVTKRLSEVSSSVFFEYEDEVNQNDDLPF